ncbi:MAG: protein translocase subunit SecF [Rickettsiaceae bacterium]|nr:protein translocase subunit SecF [Rickettsiaceae bacterium]
MQLFPLKLIPDNTNINFVKFRKLNYIIAIALVLLSLLHVIVFQFNYGIDFVGGISIDIQTKNVPEISKMRTLLSEEKIGEVVIQNFGTENNVSIRVAAQQNLDFDKTIEIIKNKLDKNFPNEIEYRQIDFVGPQVGAQIVWSGFQAIILAFAAIMVYVWFRFEWQFGLGVVSSLIHDTILCLGFISYTRLDFNLSTIAAILTVIGYSVNDSVVIYDRIRENFRKYTKKDTKEIINSSINETLSRTTLTVLTTLLANLALILFGGEALRSFSLVVFVGIIVGTYSSIFVSAPILTLFNLKKFTGKRN